MRPFVLSIAGHDPCAGAGILADAKVFDYLKVTGLGVVSAITYQNDEEFSAVKWLTIKEIEKQLVPLKKYPVRVVKIGLIESFEVLDKVLNLVRFLFGEVYVIWDPILKASAGFLFHKNNFIPENLKGKIQLITPNFEEYKQLGLNVYKKECLVLLKGGHREDKEGVDVLITKETEVEISGEIINNKKDKHGTGCVLSSAIAAYIALKKTELEACVLAKGIVEQYILSNDSKLGYL